MFFTRVCDSVHRGVSAPVHAGIHLPGPEADTPQEQTPRRADNPLEQTPPPGPEADTPRAEKPTPRADSPTQCMLGDTGNKRAVRILLECILVFLFITVYLNIFQSSCN